jgi:hypothetical protein
MNGASLTSIRASSLSELFDCPARWAAKHIDGKRLPSSGASRLGTSVHASTALFDAKRLVGDMIDPDDAIEPLVEAIYRPDEDVVWDDDLTQPVAEKVGIALHRLYCDEIAPQQQYAAVELTCERLDIVDIGISLTGTTDRIRLTEQGYGIADIKTGKSAVGADGKVKTTGHAAQTAVYELLAEQVLGRPIRARPQIIGLQTAKTPRGLRAGIGEIDSTRDLLVGDEECPGLLFHAGKILKSGDFFGNARSTLCSEKYCPIFKTCPWKG